MENGTSFDTPVIPGGVSIVEILEFLDNFLWQWHCPRRFFSLLWNCCQMSPLVIRVVIWKEYHEISPVCFKEQFLWIVRYLRYITLVIARTLVDCLTTSFQHLKVSRRCRFVTMHQGSFATSRIHRCSDDLKIMIPPWMPEFWFRIGGSGGAKLFY